MNIIQMNSETGTLTIDDLRQQVPSAFAGERHHDRTAKYREYDTPAFVEAISATGFLPVRASEARIREGSDREGYQKHRVWFRKLEDLGRKQVDELFPEIVLTNSWDGSCCFSLMAAVFRCWCSNQCTVSEAEIAAVKIQHRGEMKLAERDVTPIAEKTRLLGETVEQWQGIELPSPWQDRFALRAHQMRFGVGGGDLDYNRSAPLLPEDLLKPRRNSDCGNDLWRVFNRVQENVVKGGFGNYCQRARARGERRRYVKPRELKGFDQLDSLNTRLWDLGREIAAKSVG